MDQVEREYLTSLTEQIQTVRARQLIVEEFANHIEEQTECYEHEGMLHEDAVAKAIQDMGNPEETGIELNRIHRPQLSYRLLGAIGILFIFGIVLQLIVNGGNGIISHIICQIGAIGIIILLSISNYNYIAVFSQYYTIGFIIVSLVLIILCQDNWDWNGITYAMYGLIPLLIAGELYQLREMKRQGIIFTAASMVLGILWIYVFGNFNTVGISECILTCAALINIAVVKRVYGTNIKEYSLLLLVIDTVSILISVLLIIQRVETGSYLFARILAIAVILFMSVASLQLSLRQQNRIGLLIGCTASISLGIRTVFALFVKEDMLPFISTGAISAILNGIYIGCIMSVSRNSKILGEVQGRNVI